MIRTLETLQLDGGLHAFDFINTVNTRHGEPVFEYLNTFEDLLSWSGKAGILRPKQLQWLRQEAGLRPKVAAVKLREAIAVRENLCLLFSSIANGKVPDASVASNFNDRLSVAFKNLNVRFRSAAVDIHLHREEISFDEPLNLIMKSAFDVLTEGDFHRIKECPRCGWIFLDTSKNGKRRWCNMNVCGSREKALEYYYRKSKNA
ncbi:CGNR zinc finger domain-containing protein [Pseudochryseolinea flava]|uniref:Zinc finger CGNR domain-containing protein n=1 Tax=Pseudochryseolinea flava TaxID=2059302 RepID=A0A364XZP2_9BACT|nr:CGNR zinc finger domain-containing protein [Pseudochryseolinea flava]RAV99983.1 hypothetical protein DQQ10_15605 [Pseudochryseolinea flava]